MLGTEHLYNSCVATKISGGKKQRALNSKRQRYKQIAAEIVKELKTNKKVVHCSTVLVSGFKMSNSLLKVVSECLIVLLSSFIFFLCLRFFFPLCFPSLTSFLALIFLLHLIYIQKHAKNVMHQRRNLMCCSTDYVKHSRSEVKKKKIFSEITEKQQVMNLAAWNPKLWFKWIWMLFVLNLCGDNGVHKKRCEGVTNNIMGTIFSYCFNYEVSNHVCKAHS